MNAMLLEDTQTIPILVENALCKRLCSSCVVICRLMLWWLESVWKEPAVDCFKVISQNFPGGTE